MEGTRARIFRCSMLCIPSSTFIPFNVSWQSLRSFKVYIAYRTVQS